MTVDLLTQKVHDGRHGNVMLHSSVRCGLSARFLALLSRRLILTQEKVRGSRLAERSAKSDDPLNLMRVMPPKEARAWPCEFPRMAFLF